jgi:5-methylcytosine-specific restriction endonuclease McrA
MAKKRLIAVSVRQMVAERANWRCEYCQSPENMAPQSFTLEHIVPSSQGGSDEPENLAYACQGCNSSKYVKTEAPDPITKIVVPHI